MGSSKTLHEALALAQSEFDKIEKGEQGYKFTYAGLDTVLAVLRPALAKHGLSISTRFLFSPATTCTATGVLTGEHTLVRTSLTHGASGESIESDLPLDISDPDAKVVGGKITYWRRYQILALAGAHPGGEDDDQQAAKNRKKTPPAVKKIQFDSPAPSEREPSFTFAVGSEEPARPEFSKWGHDHVTRSGKYAEVTWRDMAMANVGSERHRYLQSFLGKVKNESTKIKIANTIWRIESRSWKASPTLENGTGLVTTQ